MNLESHHDSVQGLFIKCAELSKHISNIDNQLIELKQKGVLNAHTHFRDGKYLYLVYPVVNGSKRDRKYIGSNPDKIKKITEAIARYKSSKKLSKQKINILETIGRVSKLVDSALNELQGNENELKVVDL